ncbi:MAG: pitrilysin family protein [Chloroflexota bacterium]|nr:pitrilysin family protein [Chloroflexota bacterium]MDE2941252.1 pitrilysin family protein [Chloroflexota bacterium]MDE3267814.1 pitrilysin family protein [Chloroflexota bacterium]
MQPIEFEKFTLSNGLDVILHRDNALPLVAVNVWYHVGSKDETPGKTGYAHLFEHLMFEGSKHHNSGYFEPLQEVGATLNGSTTPDRTNYWETLPSHYLELALWLESDRMGFLVDALDQSRFDIQRDVVKNERRQSYENRPYGVSGIHLQGAVYPLPHPYHWPTIGFHEDLDVATLEDAIAFFRRFYTPSNASLAIAGDIRPEQAAELAERYFGDIPPGPSLPRATRTDTPLQGRADLTLHDKVTLPRWSIVWPTVPRFHPDEASLSVLASLLGDGKSSRLHRSLVYERQIAQSAAVRHGPSEIAGDFHLDVTAAAGHTAEEVAETALTELRRLQDAPPLPEELERVRNRLEWQQVRLSANIGGFGGRANRLNSYNVFAGDPGRMNSDMERFLAVQPEDVQRAARAYLGERQVQMVVLPEPSRSHASAGIDRTHRPSPATPGAFTPPLPERRRLSNGLEVLVVEKRELPAVSFALVLNSGGASDPASLPGLASFTTAMLQEGTAGRTSSRIADEMEFMGSQLATMTGRETTTLASETLTRHFPKALEIAADLVQNAAFPAEELDRVRRERLTSLRRMRDDPTAMAARHAPGLILGRESAFGHPISGNEESVQAISRDDMAGFYRRDYGPGGSTLVVVGDASLDEVAELAEQWFGSWQAASGNGAAHAAQADGAPPTPTTLYLLDKPGAAQSVIRVGLTSVPRRHPDYPALALLNHLFGGQFTARLNMNLREDKGYSYGYRSWFEWHRGLSLFMVGGGVQTAVTREAVEETLRELRDLVGERPVTEAEFESARTAMLRQFPSSFETSWQVLEQLVHAVFFNLPDDYHRTLPAAIEAVTLEDVRRAAAELVDNGRLTLLVVGDRETIEPGLRDVGLPLRLLDQEGLEVQE